MSPREEPPSGAAGGTLDALPLRRLREMPDSTDGVEVLHCRRVHERAAVVNLSRTTPPADGTIGNGTVSSTSDRGLAANHGVREVQVEVVAAFCRSISRRRHIRGCARDDHYSSRSRATIAVIDRGTCDRDGARSSSRASDPIGHWDHRLSLGQRATSLRRCVVPTLREQWS